MSDETCEKLREFFSKTILDRAEKAEVGSKALHESPDIADWEAASEAIEDLRVLTWIRDEIKNKGICTW